MSDYIVQHVMEIVKKIHDDTGVRLKEFSVTWGYSLDIGRCFVGGGRVEVFPLEGHQLDADYVTRIIDTASKAYERWNVMFKKFTFDWKDDELEGCHYRWEREEDEQTSEERTEVEEGTEESQKEKDEEKQKR